MGSGDGMLYECNGCRRYNEDSDGRTREGVTRASGGMHVRGATAMTAGELRRRCVSVDMPPPTSSGRTRVNTCTTATAGGQ